MNEKREKACQIVELFENLLEEKKIEVPCADDDEQKERHLNDNSANLYGMEFWNLVDKIEAML